MLWRLTWKRRGCCIDPNSNQNQQRQGKVEINARKQIYLNKSPYITQLCYIIYDVESRTTEETFCSYVKIPDNVAITEEITKRIHPRTFGLGDGYHRRSRKISRKNIKNATSS
jgi:hypothetical protein